MRYLALLRGINVGGNNIVRMNELRACLEAMGHENVTTYIQSGNVLFDSPVRSSVVLMRAIEQGLSERLLKSAQIVVVSELQLRKVATQAPAPFGSAPEEYRYDVIFVRPPLRALGVLPTISLKEGVDQVFEKNGVLYFQRLTSKAGESKLTKLLTSATSKSMTVRNWRTTTRLYELMRTPDSASI